MVTDRQWAQLDELRRRAGVSDEPELRLIVHTVVDTNPEPGGPPIPAFKGDAKALIADVLSKLPDDGAVYRMILDENGISDLSSPPITKIRDG